MNGEVVSQLQMMSNKRHKGTNNGRYNAGCHPHGIDGPYRSTFNRIGPFNDIWLGGMGHARPHLGTTTNLRRIWYSGLRTLVN